MKQDYAKITEMSEEFNEWQNGNGNMVFDDASKTMAWKARMWELRFQLAIAQQLSIVAGHLGKIVGKAERK